MCCMFLLYYNYFIEAVEPTHFDYKTLHNYPILSKIKTKGGKDCNARSTSHLRRYKKWHQIIRNARNRIERNKTSICRFTVNLVLARCTFTRAGKKIKISCHKRSARRFFTERNVAGILHIGKHCVRKKCENF